MNFKKPFRSSIDSEWVPMLNCLAGVEYLAVLLRINQTFLYKNIPDIPVFLNKKANKNAAIKSLKGLRFYRTVFYLFSYLLYLDFA